MVEFYFDEHLFEQYGIELAKQCHGCSLQHTPAKTGLMQHLLENDKQFPRELVRTGGVVICQQPQCMDRAGKKSGRNLQKTTRRWYCGTCCMKRATWAQLFQWDPQVQGWKQLLKACWHCQDPVGCEKCEKLRTRMKEMRKKVKEEKELLRGTMPGGMDHGGQLVAGPSAPVAPQPVPAVKKNGKAPANANANNVAAGRNYNTQNPDYGFALRTALGLIQYIRDRERALAKKRQSLSQQELHANKRPKTDKTHLIAERENTEKEESDIRTVKQVLFEYVAEGMVS
ncbi:hypothetical protein KFL_002440080 [Klebsormidium nitens]|uniref:Uncharacterized protein n=1 Tax=Klebsormidium nitens TaxID=105231 RepID=A0A1Y1I6P0_KLENI|nr:hypothetical protein KFL_002440080 [Klebsormidium nitens]|eukprot:GAQ85602.1 hypothetical protein KFL_002440080 [Klebsormidium nitens]